MPRFPYYQVNLRKGFFWSKWHTTEKLPTVRKERPYPCQYIPIHEQGIFPFRVIAHGNKIIVEFNHSLTDGMGALTFLRSLVGEYLHVQGVEVENWGNLFRPNQLVEPGEFQYGLREHFKLGMPKLPKITKAFHLPHRLDNRGVFNVITGKVPVKEILQISRSYKVTLTEFLVAIYLDTLQEILLNLPKKQQRKLQRPIRIMVPINCRNIFASKSMRNFTAFVAPGIDPRLGEYSFQEIIDQVHFYKNLQVNKKYLTQQISTFVGIELNPFVAFTPRFVKSWFVRPIYRNLGEAIFSGIMTNLGVTAMPTELSKYIDDMNLISMYHPYFKTGCGLITYKNTLNINFGRSIKEPVVEEIFFKKLQEHQVSLQVKKLTA
jgi:NRPS condensation-like uncharacterized protein